MIRGGPCDFFRHVAGALVFVRAGGGELDCLAEGCRGGIGSHGDGDELRDITHGQGAVVADGPVGGGDFTASPGDGSSEPLCRDSYFLRIRGSQFTISRNVVGGAVRERAGGSELLGMTHLDGRVRGVHRKGDQGHGAGFHRDVGAAALPLQGGGDGGGAGSRGGGGDEAFRVNGDGAGVR